MTPVAERLRLVARAVRGVSRRLRRIPPRELLTLLHATMVLVIVEVALRAVALPRLCRALGVRLDQDPTLPGAEPAVERLDPTTERALNAARRVTTYWPFSSGPCLRRSLVGGHLIRRLSPTLRLGVAPAGTDIRAHAWLEIDGTPLEDVAEFLAFEMTPSVWSGRTAS